MLEESVVVSAQRLLQRQSVRRLVPQLVWRLPPYGSSANLNEKGFVVDMHVSDLHHDPKHNIKHGMLGPLSS